MYIYIIPGMYYIILSIDVKHAVGLRHSERRDSSAIGRANTLRPAAYTGYRVQGTGYPVLHTPTHHLHFTLLATNGLEALKPPTCSVVLNQTTILHSLQSQTIFNTVQRRAVCRLLLRGAYLVCIYDIRTVPIYVAVVV